jgi:hypothetical protein
MSKRITIEDDVYETLLSLKAPGDSFTKVLRRHVHAPAKTNAKLVKWPKSGPLPQPDLKILNLIEKGRGRRRGAGE